MTVRSVRVVLVKGGGYAALAVSLALLQVIAWRHSINALSVGTVVLGAVGGITMALAGENRGTLAIAAALLIVGAVPALIGGLGWLYVPSIAIAIAAAV